MELTTHHRTSTVLLAGLFALTAVTLAPATAHASRLPADPITYVGAPIALTRLVLDTQAANVWAALADIRSA